MKSALTSKISRFAGSAQSLLWTMPLALLAACSTDGLDNVDGSNLGPSAGEFRVQGNQIIARGEVDVGALEALQSTLAANPEVSELVLQFVPGSADDDENLKLAAYVRSKGLSTRVPSNGLVASGGTDLFLAGIARTVEAGACLGVHSWAFGDGGPGQTGDTVPRSSSEHQPYLDYYAVMGIPADFYWFTLEAAPASDMHWMSQEEMARYNMVTAQYVPTGNQAMCEARIEAGPT